MLEKLLDKFRAELDGYQKEELNNKFNFETLVQELVGNIAILAVAAATLTPGWLLARVGTSIAAPALAGTPTVLATLGVWRVAHPALSKASRAVTGFASNVGRRFKKITPFWGR